MRSFNKLSANGLMWLLAALVAAHPAFSLDCSCQCGDAQAGSCHEECGEHGAHAHRNCDASASCCHVDLDCQHSSVDVPWDCSRLLSLGIRPCHCPDDCNCQLRHEVRIGIVSPAKGANVGKPAAIPQQRSVADGARKSVAAAKPLCTRNPPQKRTALEICAHLCRFTA